MLAPVRVCGRSHVVTTLSRHRPRRGAVTGHAGTYIGPMWAKRPREVEPLTGPWRAEGAGTRAESRGGRGVPRREGHLLGLGSPEGPGTARARRQRLEDVETGPEGAAPTGQQNAMPFFLKYPSSITISSLRRAYPARTVSSICRRTYPKVSGLRAPTSELRASHSLRGRLSTRLRLENTNHTWRFSISGLHENMGPYFKVLPKNTVHITMVGLPSRPFAGIGLTRTTPSGSSRNYRKSLVFFMVASTLLLAAGSCLFAREVTAAPGFVAACDRKHKNISFFLRKGNSARFLCADEVGVAYPAFGSAKYCEGADCSSEASLSSIPGVQVTSLKGPHGYSIVLNEAPKQKQVLHFVCSQQTESPPFQPHDICVVAVTLEPDPQPQSPVSAGEQAIWCGVLPFRLPRVP